MTTGQATNTERPAVTLAEATRVWLRVALLSFGGPAGQIAVMHDIVVEEKGWVSEQRFLHALNYTMLLPGPEAQQLATYLGWLLNRTAGGLIAGTLFILPGFVAIMALSVLYARYQNVGLVEALFFGLKAAVIAVVVNAVIRISRRALQSTFLLAIAAAAFIAIFFFGVPFPLIILAAGVIGFVMEFFFPGFGRTSFAHGEIAGDAEGGIDYGPHTRPNLRWSLITGGVFFSLWLGPLVAVSLVLGPESVFTQLGQFFSRAAIVTFGGAYAVLVYVAQEAVSTYGWLMPGEMLDGLGMAETTPGPLIMVLQFVGFLGAYRLAEGLPPLLAGVLGATWVVWVTFVPCFLWIFLGAPYIEYLRGSRRLAAALTAVTAAVVGVILNLAVWFAIHTLFGMVNPFTVGPIHLEIPVWRTVIWPAVFIALGAFVALYRFRAGLFPVLAACAALGIGYYLLSS
jgi:chromate transporter